jgi:hypothetical protein
MSPVPILSTAPQTAFATGEIFAGLPYFASLIEVCPPPFPVGSSRAGGPSVTGTNPVKLLLPGVVVPVPNYSAKFCGTGFASRRVSQKCARGFASGGGGFATESPDLATPDNKIHSVTYNLASSVLALLAPRRECQAVPVSQCRRMSQHRRELASVSRTRHAPTAGVGLLFGLVGLPGEISAA